MNPSLKGQIGLYYFIDLILRGTEGQLLPFLPYADEGVDVLFINRQKNELYPIQAKAAFAAPDKIIMFGGIKPKIDEVQNKILVLIYSPDISKMPEMLWILPYKEALKHTKGKNGTIWLKSDKDLLEYKVSLGKDFDPILVASKLLQFRGVRNLQ